MIIDSEVKTIKFLSICIDHVISYFFLFILCIYSKFVFYFFFYLHKGYDLPHPNHYFSHRIQKLVFLFFCHFCIHSYEPLYAMVYMLSGICSVHGLCLKRSTWGTKWTALDHSLLMGVSGRWRLSTVISGQFYHRWTIQCIWNFTQADDRLAFNSLVIQGLSLV